MELTTTQTELLMCLRRAIQTKQCHRIVYCTEYLGYLPFGLYHWIETDGEDISAELRSESAFDWHREDLEALRARGFLTKIDEWTNPSDELETKTTFEVTLAPRCSA
jgi:hypothetical protein